MFEVGIPLEGEGHIDLAEELRTVGTDEENGVVGLVGSSTVCAGMLIVPVVRLYITKISYSVRLNSNTALSACGLRALRSL